MPKLATKEALPAVEKKNSFAATLSSLKKKLSKLLSHKEKGIQSSFGIDAELQEKTKPSENRNSSPDLLSDASSSYYSMSTTMSQTESGTQCPDLKSIKHSPAQTAKVLLVREIRRNAFKECTNPVYARKRFDFIKNELDIAVSQNKIFMLMSSCPNKTLYESLTERGWVQKLMSSQLCELDSKIQSTNDVKQFIDMQIRYKLLKNIPADFIWSNMNFNQLDSVYHPFYSRLQKREVNFDFANKVGLSLLIQQIHWGHEFENLAGNCIFPRSYAIRTEADKKSFIDDFRLTMCTSFLYYLYTKLDELSSIFAYDGTKSTNCVLFALEQASNIIQNKQQDEENSTESISIKSKRLSGSLFDSYFNTFHKIINNNWTIKIQNDENPEMFRQPIKHAVTKLLEYFPNIASDGYSNIWILKPMRGGCGHGILISNNENQIVKIINNQNYVLQKYIERPLLVYKTKFDIRQYILITMRNNFMQIWIYNNCYLKFSSREFALNNFSKAIHVTNHTVQKNLKNGKRSPELPACNMWTLNDFLRYLDKKRLDYKWSEQVFPGIISGVKQILHAALEGMEYVENNFQLFGADFMITEDFIPVLLEINATPDLSHSTPVTAIVCSEVVEDMLKVLIDGRDNKYCQTGNFQKIAEIPMTTAKIGSTDHLVAYGRRILTNKNI